MSSTSTSPAIVVLGSLNMDLLMRVPRAPQAGETLLGRSLQHLPGGKGGNQAVSCARQGAAVTLIARVGRDADGDALCAALSADGIRLDAVQRDDTEATGVALVMVEDSAQNRIVVIPGANLTVTLDEAVFAQALQGAGAFVTQLESPLSVVLRAVALAQAAGCPVVLNPSPMQPLPDALWPQIDTLVVNEVEAAEYTGLPVADGIGAVAAARALMQRGVRRVVVTLGAQGAVSVDAQAAVWHPSLKVQAVDTTAAGDTFTGALAVALARGAALPEAARRGIRAAALCVTRPGAQPSIPHASEVDAMPEPPPWSAL
ncbi:ribokinase [Aquincola tertiaricarbonis]|uniref:Ribokinase n=1 Tax=Aquincola tertiaricarbonis TaxID=391953 RepID=A0ABY4S691_AQUTE|nr:ribokinase [Aquincola tertiaricarbonis]URI08518.1 ribokinase [Aquincola tertiaricarbonis]